MFSNPMLKYQTKHSIHPKLYQITSKHTFGKDITNYQCEKTNRTKDQIDKISKSKQLKLSLTVDNSVLQSDPIKVHQTDIIDYLLETEKCNIETFTCLTISREQRCRVINKLIAMHSNYKLQQNTLYLALAYFEEYISKIKIETKKIMSVGVVCLWIASKYEEIYPPRPKYFIKDSQVSSYYELTSIQGSIIKTLEFQLVRNTPLIFLQILVPHDSKQYCLANYLMLSYIYRNSYKQINPVLLALCALKFTDHLLKTKHKTDCLQNICEQFTKQEKSECFKQLCKSIQNAVSEGSPALKLKYSKQKYYYVSKIKLEIK